MCTDQKLVKTLKIGYLCRRGILLLNHGGSKLLGFNINKVIGELLAKGIGKLAYAEKHLLWDDSCCRGESIKR